MIKLLTLEHLLELGLATDGGASDWRAGFSHTDGSGAHIAAASAGAASSHLAVPAATGACHVPQI